MKKTLIKMAALAAVFMAFTGCNSTKVVLTDHAPIVLVSSLGNGSIPWWDEDRADELKDMDGLLTKGINSVLGQTNPEILTAQDRIDYTVTSFETLVSENAGIEVISKETLLNSEVYKRMRSSTFSSFNPKTFASDYLKIEELGGKTARALMQDVGANSYVILDFTFNKIIVDGSNLGGKLCASCKMEVSMYNNQGKRILSDTFKATSTETLDISMLSYDKDALVELFPDLIDLTINQFIVKYL